MRSLLCAQAQLLTRELASRDLIVSSFLLLVGVSLVLAYRAGISPRRFRRRIALITFGILDRIVVSSVCRYFLQIDTSGSVCNSLTE